MLPEAPPGALRLRSFESTSMEESKAREKSLNGLSAWPTARFPLRALSSFCISFLFARPIHPFRARFVPSPAPRLSPPLPAYILSVDAHVVVSPSPSVSRWTLAQGQPLVNLIISATPDKRRRQNVIPACSRSSPSSSRIPSGADG